MGLDNNNLTFGNVSALDYDIYIKGKDNYNTPARSIKQVDIPGRNGALTIDYGNYENLTINYDAYAYGTSQDEVRAKITTFKNALMSQVGYQRLADTYTPYDYRLALYVDTLEVNQVCMDLAVKFTLSFNCKPQRYLTSGQEEVTVTNNTIINNPTLYDAEPLLMVKGYGTIAFNGYEVEIANETIGDVYPFSAQGTTFLSASETREGRTLPTLSGTVRDVFESGDSIKVKPSCGVTVATDTITTYNNKQFPWYVGRDDPTTYTVVSGSTPALVSSRNSAENSASASLDYPIETFTKGTSETKTIQGNLIVMSSAQGPASGSTGGSSSVVIVELTEVYTTIPITLTLTYDGDVTITYRVTFGTITYETYLQGELPSDTYPTVSYTNRSESLSEALSTSSRSALGDPTYIDCEIGEAYMYSNDELVGLNAYIDLGSDLPKLASGQNTFTVDNTITELIVVPRYWQL